MSLPFPLSHAHCNVCFYLVFGGAKIKANTKVPCVTLKYNYVGLFVCLTGRYVR